MKNITKEQLKKVQDMDNKYQWLLEKVRLIEGLQATLYAIDNGGLIFKNSEGCDMEFEFEMPTEIEHRVRDLFDSLQIEILEEIYTDDVYKKELKNMI